MCHEKGFSILKMQNPQTERSYRSEFLTTNIHHMHMNQYLLAIDHKYSLIDRDVFYSEKKLLSIYLYGEARCLLISF